MSTPTSPRHNFPFLVTSLNSFNRFAKEDKAAARRQFDAMNEKPKVPSLFPELKTATCPGKLKTPIKKDAKAPGATVKSSCKVVVERKPAAKTAIPLLTPPSEKVVRRDTRPSARILAKSVVSKRVQVPSAPAAVILKKARMSPKPGEVAHMRVQTAHKPVNLAEPMSASPEVSRSAQLATPPPTPPVALVVQCTAPKPIAMRMPTIIKTGKPAFSGSLPTPRHKTLVAKGTPVVPKRVSKKPLKPESVPIVVEAEVIVPTAEADIVPVAPVKALAAAVSTRPCDEVVEVAQLEKEDNTDAVTKISLPTPPPKVAEEYSFHRQRSLALDQRKNAYARRTETSLASPTSCKEIVEGLVVGKAPASYILDVKESTEDTAVAATSTKNDEVRDDIKTVGGAVSNGIRARMAALFGSASVSCGPIKSAPGTYVRRLKIPELDEGSQASQNQRIQRDVEALRTMKRVGSGSHAIVRTKAFGGSLAANYAAGEGQLAAASSERMTIAARREKE